MNKICVIGAGAFGTALSNVIASEKNKVLLYSIEKDVVNEINNYHKNSKYFPNILLNSQIRATYNDSELDFGDILFLAIPSKAVFNFVLEKEKYFRKDAIIINLAKGFSVNGDTIYDSLFRIVDNPIASLKGPTFAAELIHKTPSALTLGATNNKVIEKIKSIFENTCITLDFTNDILGVELTSILKNVYAIIIGLIDASYNSSNVRFKIFTESVLEMRKILKIYGANEETIFNYCGIGDLGLTALNDLSRNRTLGLLIGKGFYNNAINVGVVLEGRRAIDTFYEKLENFVDINSLFLGKLAKYFQKQITLQELLKQIG